MKTLSFYFVLILIACGAILSACKNNRQQLQAVSVSEKVFGNLNDSTLVIEYSVSNGRGLHLKALNYGGIITSLLVPDRNGNLVDVVLGFDSLSDYTTKSPYFGAIIGRYGNRIANATFKIDNIQYNLNPNNGPNHLHGGIKGFDKVIWNVEPFKDKDVVGLKFTYISPDGEEGYPGNLSATVTYTLTPDNELIFSYEATTDKATPINLTQHTYFNLNGKENILDHSLLINASGYNEVDSLLIPTGVIADVEGTPFNFRESKPIGKDILLINTNPVGYDHNFVLDSSDINMPVVILRSETSGIVMEIFTDQPGVQFYSGNFLDGSLKGKNGQYYQQYSGLCLETQHFPDSPNNVSFPNTILRPGETYIHKSIYKFGVK